MKILHCVESFFPSKGGMQEVALQLGKRLVKMGHEVTVATRKIPERDFAEKDGMRIVEFDISGNLVNGIHGEAEKYIQFLVESDFDIITFFAAQQWATDLALDLLPRIKAKKVSVPTGYSGMFQEAYRDYFIKMKDWIRNYDMNVFLSYDYRDINFAKENGVKNWTVIPNGAAEDEFLEPGSINVRKALGIDSAAKIILHIGSYTGRKGHRETLDIYYRTKTKNTFLLMIGNDADGFYRQYIKYPLLGLRFLTNKLLRRKPFLFKGFSREFTVAAYKQSDLFLFPSNIECSPVVLFECAAAKLPFISTDVGNAKEIAGWTGGGLIAPTMKDPDGYSFIDINAAAKMTDSLLADDEKRKELSGTAFKNWTEKFSWEIIAKQYESMYLSLLK